MRCVLTVSANQPQMCHGLDALGSSAQNRCGSVSGRQARIAAKERQVSESPGGADRRKPRNRLRQDPGSPTPPDVVGLAPAAADADPGRDRHRQGACWPARCTGEPRGTAVRSSTSTAPPSPRTCWRASFSATSAAPSPTRAARSRACFELADGGTLFLDEIGELPEACRPSCSACDRWRFARVGGERDSELVAWSSRPRTRTSRTRCRGRAFS